MQTTLNPHEQSLINYYLPNATTLTFLSEFFAVFADPSRLKILTALSITSLCVTDIARYCQMQQSTVSHQLGYLRRAKVVGFDRQGKVLYYSITSPYVAGVLEIATQALAKNYPT